MCKFCVNCDRQLTTLVIMNLMDFIRLLIITSSLIAIVHGAGYKVNTLNQVAYGYQGTLSLLGYFILFYFILFYFILFYFILFYFILFYFILFYFILLLLIYYLYIRPGPYGSDIATPAFEVYFQTQDILRVRIYDPNNARYK